MPPAAPLMFECAGGAGHLGTCGAPVWPHFVACHSVSASTTRRRRRRWPKQRPNVASQGSDSNEHWGRRHDVTRQSAMWRSRSLPGLEPPECCVGARIYVARAVPGSGGTTGDLVQPSGFAGPAEVLGPIRSRPTMGSGSAATPLSPMLQRPGDAQRAAVALVLPPITQEALYSRFPPYILFGSLSLMRFGAARSLLIRLLGWPCWCPAPAVARRSFPRPATKTGFFRSRAL